jgi:colicin import membrane protein
MARKTNITYDQVAAVCESLAAVNAPITIGAVREKLVVGSPNTIHPYLKAWKANVPKAAAPVIELPETITRELSAWVTRAAAASRADVEIRLAVADTEAADLAQAGQALEAERDELQEQITALTTQRDQAEATALERAGEIERLSRENERERKLAGDAQIEAAQAKLKADDQLEKISDLKGVNSHLTLALETETARRVDAEKAAAVLLSERDAARKEAEEERTRIKGLQAHLDAAIAKTEQTRADYEKRIAETVDASGKAVASERAAADIERAAAQSALMENAGLRAKLESAEHVNARLESEVEKLIIRLDKMPNAG